MWSKEKPLRLCKGFYFECLSECGKTTLAITDDFFRELFVVLDAVRVVMFSENRCQHFNDRMTVLDLAFNRIYR